MSTQPRVCDPIWIALVPCPKCGAGANEYHRERCTNWRCCLLRGHAGPCDESQLNAHLYAAGVRPASAPMARTDRQTVKRNPWWLALLLRVAARLGLG